MFERLQYRVRRILRRRWRRTPLPTIWYHPDYRVPVEGLGLETKRADLALWTLVDLGVIDEAQVERPRRATYEELAAVHSERILESFSDPRALASVFGATPGHLAVDEVSRTIRLAAGGTVEAARKAVQGGGPQINLLGGFHHAAPDRAGGFCVVNDIAVAMMALRRDGFGGTFAVLDVDAHPPDGTLDCVRVLRDEVGDVWVGSLSGSDWGYLHNADEKVITGADDADYIVALDQLLDRMPDADLTFVVAGGDILEGDRFGELNVSVDGAYRRDLRIARRLRGKAQVWLAAGGYSDNAWKVLTNTVASVALRDRLSIPPKYEPLREHMARIAKGLVPPVDNDSLITELDLALAFGFTPPGGPRFLGTYTSEWFEVALYRYGMLSHVRRLGYHHFRIELSRDDGGDKMRLFGRAGEVDHLLVAAELDRAQWEGKEFLFVNWLTLRHPLAVFSSERPRLPNQEVPGLGLAREAGELLALMAERLHMAGVSLRPAAFHVAYTARHDFQFADAERQGLFEKLVADLGKVPLAKLTVAIDEERVLLDGKPYRWEPDLMIARLSGEKVVATPAAGRFSLDD